MKTETLDVRIVTLEPIRVASAHAFGAGPETVAWDQLIAWAKGRGLWNDGAARRYFGFNNPDPSPGSPNYGYETWMTVGPEVEGDGDITVKEFGGGLYAVTHCAVKDPGADIFGTWQKLVGWVENSSYRHATHQWLEEHFFHGEPDFSDFALDLYMPIR